MVSRERLFLFVTRFLSFVTYFKYPCFSASFRYFYNIQSRLRLIELSAVRSVILTGDFIKSTIPELKNTSRIDTIITKEHLIYIYG